MTYNPQIIEKKWQKFWETKKTFEVSENPSKKKYYILEMFPYPSGKIHMGHVRVYTIGDVIARQKRMLGYNVLHPMGWDSFGMPAENAAISLKMHPSKWTYDNIKIMKKQLKRLGFSYDWSREITTCDSKYYIWEQWIFLKMLEEKMVYRKKSFVNWCENCKTVLANEQVINNMCWRCEKIIKQKKLWQWFLKITDYADDLLTSCDKLVGWPEKVLSMQKNWIGKSTGIKIDFPIKEFNDEISVFTTRPDTIFGVSFISVSPEHSIIKKITKNNELSNFIKKTLNLNKISKIKNKEGIFSGIHCINPINGEKIPVYIVNFVLMNYGTGAIMSVPAHDQRDYEFAKKYNLPIKIVIKSKKTFNKKNKKVYTGEGIIINSNKLNGLNNFKDFDKIISYLQKKKIGQKTINFRLKDWGISRQRYWGTPIPVVHCDTCGVIPVKKEELPIILPENLNISTNSMSTLACNMNFIKTKCPKCNKNNAKRETDTMDTFIESSWYFQRFCSPKTDKVIFDKKNIKYWMPVDQYIGGIEHAILHLLYTRYFTRVLKKFGLVNYKEPFLQVLTQGMVTKSTFKCSKDGFLLQNEINSNKQKITCKKCGNSVIEGKTEKMSKSKKNVVDPDVLINKYGSDTVRLFCLFTAPPQKDLEWNSKGVEGCSRFLNKVWNIISIYKKLTKDIKPEKKIQIQSLSPSLLTLLKEIHKTIKKVSQDIEIRFNFNTAISSIMELANKTKKYLPENNENLGVHKQTVLRFSLETIILLLSPMVPHFCEELWYKLDNTEPLNKKIWPKYDKELIIDNEIDLIIQVNGKLRDKIKIKQNTRKDIIEKLVLNREKVKKFIENKKIIKTILIKNRLINIVL